MKKLSLPLEAMDRDVRSLAEAISCGEISVSPCGEALSERVSYEEAYTLARNTINYLLTHESFSLLFVMINSKRWLEAWQAELYMGLGYKTLVKLVEKGAIKGEKIDDTSTAPMRFCRLSIDEHLSRSKIGQDAKIKAREFVRAGKLGGG